MAQRNERGEICLSEDDVSQLLRGFKIKIEDLIIRCPDWVLPSDKPRDGEWIQ